jgi:hypothetical protein
LRKQTEFEEIRKAEFAILAAGNRGDRHQGVEVEGVERLMRRRVAAQNDQAAPDRVQHAPEVDAILGITVQMRLEGAVAVRPAAQGALGMDGLAAYFPIGHGSFGAGHLFVEFRKGAVPGLLYELPGLCRVGRYPLGDRFGLFGGQLAGESCGGDVRLLGQALAGCQRALGRGRTDTGMVRQMIGGGAVSFVAPAVAVGCSGCGKRFKGGYGGFHLSADVHHPGGLGRQQVPGDEVTRMGLDRLS